MTASVEFLFDFGSPNAYLSHKVLPGIEQRTNVKISYVPVLLGGIFKATNNQSPFMAYANIDNKMAYEQLEMERFIEKHQLSQFKLNSHFPVNTLTIMRAAIAAQRLNVFDDYVEAVFSAMWEQSLKMDDPQVISDYLSGLNLPAAALLEATSEQSVKDELLVNTNKAVERGAFGIPTFFVNDEMFFGKDRLVDFEAMIVRLQ